MARTVFGSAKFIARPYNSGKRYFNIPQAVVNYLWGQKADSGVIDQTNCLFQIDVFSEAGNRVQSLPPLVLKPTSGGEVYVKAKGIRGWPTPFKKDEFLVVEIVPLE